MPQTLHHSAPLPLPSMRPLLRVLVGICVLYYLVFFGIGVSFERATHDVAAEPSAALPITDASGN